MKEGCKCEKWVKAYDEAEWYTNYFMDTFDYCPYCGRELPEFKFEWTSPFDGSVWRTAYSGNVSGVRYDREESCLKR